MCWFGAWVGFRVYVSTKLKNYFSFKKRYMVTNLGLVGYNKRFLNGAVGAPSCMHDARLLRNSSIYRNILNNELVNLERYLLLLLERFQDTLGCLKVIMKETGTHNRDILIRNYVVRGLWQKTLMEC